jgi:hypothetical protein
MSYFDALYGRYLEAANAHAAKFGLDPNVASRREPPMTTRSRAAPMMP